MHLVPPEEFTAIVCLMESNVQISFDELLSNLGTSTVDFSSFLFSLCCLALFHNVSYSSWDGIFNWLCILKQG